MSMTTATPKKKNRLAALAVAALLVAGGAVAVPQAASAAMVGKNCTNARTCSMMVHTSDQDVSFQVRGESRLSHNYTVRTPGGRLLCSGSIIANGSNRLCFYGSYKGKVKITVAQNFNKRFSIIAAY